MHTEFSWETSCKVTAWKTEEGDRITLSWILGRCAVGMLMEMVVLNKVLLPECQLNSVSVKH
jgi:hypothetical protein